MTPLVSFCWMGAGVISLTLAFVQLCCFLCSAFAISVSSVNSVQALNPQLLLVSQRLLCRAVQKVRCRFERAILGHQLNSEAIVMPSESCHFGWTNHFVRTKLGRHALKLTMGPVISKYCLGIEIPTMPRKHGFFLTFLFPSLKS